MAYMNWSEAISVGEPTIDAEHRELMEIINQLQDGLQTPVSEDAIGKTFQRLTDCTTLHFRSEEKLFLGSDYPRAAIHVRKHEHLLLILACFQTGFDTAGKRVPITDQLNFLRDWLLDHIANEDVRLGKYLATQAGAKSFANAMP